MQLPRRAFLQSSAALGVLWHTPAQATAPPLSARLMATLDIHCRDDVPTRGLIAAEVLEQVHSSPEGTQQAPEMQAVLQRACLWFGQATQALRGRLVALRDGGPIDPESLNAALELIEPTRGSLARQQASAAVRRRLQPGQRARFARRLIARIDHASQRAERQAAREGSLDVGWLRDQPEAQQGKQNILQKILTIILLVVLAILLLIGLVLLIGGVLLVLGALSGNTALIAMGFVIVLAGIVALVLLVLDADQPPERAARSASTRVRLAPRSL